MCSRELGPEHEHLVEPANRKLICACDACAILFEGQSGARYKRVQRRVLFLRDFQLTDAQWDGLMVSPDFCKSTCLICSRNRKLGYRDHISDAF